MKLDPLSSGIMENSISVIRPLLFSLCTRHINSRVSILHYKREKKPLKRHIHLVVGGLLHLDVNV
jgi:hypothetical protein